MTRRCARAVAALLIGVLLFAQMAVAAYACPAGAGPATPCAMGPSMEDGSADMDGMDGMAGMAMGAMDPQNANLCAEHCKLGQQSDQASTLSVPAALLMALYFAPPMLAPTAGLRFAAAGPGGGLAAWAPHTILHCCLRI